MVSRLHRVKDVPSIVIADDDVDDRLMTTSAFAEVKSANPLVEVRNGEELLDYLHRRGNFAHLSDTPLPGLILLDLNMPLMDGREALNEIKRHPDFVLMGVSGPSQRSLG